MSSIEQLLSIQVEPFPDSELASAEGLIAIGGDLTPHRLVQAYCKGIFPWYNPGEPILWWTPDPRCVIYPESFKPSRSLAKRIRNTSYEFKFDSNFTQVIERCSEPRRHEKGTWIGDDMKIAYIRLNEMGIAHSAEIWIEGELVGGLYGIAIGGAFFGESMFSKETDSSKMALMHLVDYLYSWNFSIIDCQISSNHMLSLGAVEVSRKKFLEDLDYAIKLPGKPGSWKKY